MKQGKGDLWGAYDCRECGKRIEASADGLTYWATERLSSHYGDVTYYHRSCARRVTARRVAERERNTAEARAVQATQQTQNKPQAMSTTRRAGKR